MKRHITPKALWLTLGSIATGTYLLFSTLNGPEEHISGEHLAAAEQAGLVKIVEQTHKESNEKSLKKNKEFEQLYQISNTPMPSISNKDQMLPIYATVDPVNIRDCIEQENSSPLFGEEYTKALERMNKIYISENNVAINETIETEYNNLLKDLHSGNPERKMFGLTPKICGVKAIPTGFLYNNIEKGISYISVPVNPFVE